MTKILFHSTFFLSLLLPSIDRAVHAADWVTQLQSELPAVIQSRFTSLPDVKCRVTTSKEGQTTVDDIFLQQKNMCYERSQGKSGEKTVMVFTPDYSFRLLSDGKGSGFIINRIVEPRNSSDYQTRTRFPFQLTIENVVFAHSFIKDVRIDELLRTAAVRHIETSTDPTLGELPTYEFDLSGQPSNFQTVSATLIPAHQWALRGWTIKFKEVQGATSTETREIEYLKDDIGGVPSLIRGVTSGRPPGGQEFRIETSAQVSNIEWNTVDESVFTLPYYGLPDVLAPMNATRRWLNPWIWGSLVAALAIAWWLYKSRDHKKTA